MKEIIIKKYIKVLFVLVFLLFVLNKVFVRKWIIESEVSEFFKIISYSIPNFFEAVLGSLILTSLFLCFRGLLGKKGEALKTNYVYLLVFFFSSVYVISQELNFHSLGGPNVYDTNDIIASILGLSFSYLLMHFYGFYEVKYLKISD